ncbi:hypothetical protein ACTFIZ_006513 [Dictyostelium cf. discoideum]
MIGDIKKGSIKSDTTWVKFLSIYNCLKVKSSFFKTSNVWFINDLYSTSNVFIVNKMAVYKWFNNTFDYENELKYLEFIKGIKGIRSITEQNKTENWIHISPRGHLIKNL